jgi:hypothetical protein
VVKKILQKTLIILLGMIKSGIVGMIGAMITGVLIAGTLEVIGGALLIITFLIPAIFLYHLCRILNLKNRTCDIFYITTYIPVFAFFTYGSFVPDCEGGDQYCRFFATVIFCTGIVVYIAEVIFRGRKKVKKALIAALVFTVFSAIVIPPAYFLAKHNIIKDQKERKAYADKFIGSLANGTDYYKQCIENSLVDVNYINSFIPMMTPNYKVTYGSYSGIGAEYNCRVEFDNGKVLWLEVVDYREALQIWRITEERTKEEQMELLKGMIASIKIMKSVEANEPIDMNNIPSEARERIKECIEQRKMEKASSNK